MGELDKGQLEKALTELDTCRRGSQRILSRSRCEKGRRWRILGC